MNRIQSTRLLAVAACLLVASACSSTAASSSADSPRSSTSVKASVPTTVDKSASTITIKNFAFGSPISVKAGATVTVHNADDTAHTVSAADGSFDTMPVFAGTSKTFAAPMKPGTYKFHCNIHANMQGVLTVTA